MTPRDDRYAAARSQQALGKVCPGLHFPDVLAPWGAPMSADGVNADAGLMSNGPYSNMPIVWAWEYGSHANLTEIKERWFPLVKGEADFFQCWLQLNTTDWYVHDMHDCTNESPALCATRDTVLTMSMVRRSFDVVSAMAAAVGEPVDPKWAETLARVVPEPTGFMHNPAATASMTSTSAHRCSWCGWNPNDKKRVPTAGNCQGAANQNGNIQGRPCAQTMPNGTCPPGMGLCAEEAFGAARNVDMEPTPTSGGNSQSIFPCYPGDSVGTNSTLSSVGANTVEVAKSWSQGNSFTKIFSAAARVVGPGLLDAEDVYSNWLSTLTATQQPNFIPFNPFSGFETVGATEYVNYMLLQSDPGGFMGLFEAWPRSKGDASFFRLRGRGAFVVSSSFASGKVGQTLLLSERGSACTFRRPQSWPKIAVSVVDDATRKTVALAWEGKSGPEPGAGADIFFSFPTTAGASYTLNA